MSITKKQVFSSSILKNIQFIQQQEQEMELLRQELNHQIMFNLQDTYLNLANGQTSINIRQIANFLNINDDNQALQKFMKWNSLKNSLNLSFTQFAALLISKQDKLLAKMVLQRQYMGAIPNFLLQITRRIFSYQLSIHEYCINNRLSYLQFSNLIEEVIDENGDIDKLNFTQFIKRKNLEQNHSQIYQVEQNIFLRYLQTTGDITIQRLKYLWFDDSNSQKDKSPKFQREITCITLPKSPKSMTSYKSLKQLSTTCLLRPEYFDCINRPVITQDKQLRRNKSIEKHRKRLNLADKNLRKKKQIQRSRLNIAIKFILTKLKQIITVQDQSQNYRTEICLCADFFPVIFYDTIPRDKGNFISATNFKDYLQDFGYKFQINAIYLLYKRYCLDFSRLDFNSFCSIFDVTQPQYYLLQKNRFIQSLNDISVQTKRTYFLVLNALIVNQSKINEIKNLMPPETLNLNDALANLFSQYDQGINSIQIVHLFKKYLDYDLSRRQLKLLWRRFDNNLKSEQIIQKYQLMNQVLPLKKVKSNKQYKL